jgi:hypothetical protein
VSSLNEAVARLGKSNRRGEGILAVPENLQRARKLPLSIMVLTRVHEEQFLWTFNGFIVTDLRRLWDGYEINRNRACTHDPRSC